MATFVLQQRVEKLELKTQHSLCLKHKTQDSCYGALTEKVSQPLIYITYSTIKTYRAPIPYQEVDRIKKSFFSWKFSIPKK